MLPVGFEPTMSAGERPQTYALDRAATGTGSLIITCYIWKFKPVPRTAQQTHSVSVIKISQLLLYREIIAVCSQIHTKHINTLCGQNVEFVSVELVVHMVTTGL